MPVEIKRIDDAEFSALRDHWNDLLDRSASDSVFLRWEWIHTWWDIFKSHKTLFILTASRDGQLVGIAPFYIDRTGMFGLRTVRFCSGQLSPDYMDVIAEIGLEDEVVQAVARELRLRQDAWDLIALDNLRSESAFLVDPMLFKGYSHFSGVSHHCPYIKISGTFAEYYRPRKQLTMFGFKKKLKVLFEQKKVEHHIVSDEGHLDKALDDLLRLHQKRARDKNIQSNFLSPEIGQFHRRVSHLFFQQKILSMHFLMDGEKAISALYAFNYKAKTFVFQIAFDPEWSKWSAGAALIYFCVQRAFEDRLREFDFLKGTESYKSLWADDVREERRLTVYNGNVRGRFWLGWAELKSFVRRVKKVF